MLRKNLQERFSKISVMEQIGGLNKISIFCACTSPKNLALHSVLLIFIPESIVAVHPRQLVDKPRHITTIFLCQCVNFHIIILTLLIFCRNVWLLQWKFLTRPLLLRFVVPIFCTSLLKTIRASFYTTIYIHIYNYINYINVYFVTG